MIAENQLSSRAKRLRPIDINKSLRENLGRQQNMETEKTIKITCFWEILLTVLLICTPFAYVVLFFLVMQNVHG